MDGGNKHSVEVERDKLLEVARDLNEFVVSLDRIGSYHSKDRRALGEALTQFMIEWQVAQRLASARRTVDEALLGPNPTPADEDAIGGEDFWQPPHP